MIKKFALLMLTAAFALPLAAQQEEVGAKERKKIELIVQEYLLENPEIIAEAINELQRRRTLARMLPAIEMYRGYLEKDPGAAVLGNPEGDVTVVEFFDYRCSFCRKHFSEIQRLVAQDGNIRWIPRHFPILDRDNETPLSFIAARAGEAAHRQGKFQEFHVAMMTRPGKLTEEQLFSIAESVGLNVAKLKEDMKDRLIDKRIQNSLSVGTDIGFEGTPGYIIGDDVVLGASGFARLREAVDRARSAKLAAAK